MSNECIPPFPDLLASFMSDIPIYSRILSILYFSSSFWLKLSDNILLYFNKNCRFVKAVLFFPFSSRILNDSTNLVVRCLLRLANLYIGLFAPFIIFKIIIDSINSFLSLSLSTNLLSLNPFFAASGLATIRTPESTRHPHSTLSYTSMRPFTNSLKSPDLFISL